MSYSQFMEQYLKWYFEKINFLFIISEISATICFISAIILMAEAYCPRLAIIPFTCMVAIVYSTKHIIWKESLWQKKHSRALSG